MSGQEYLRGQSVVFACPECGEELVVFIPDGPGAPEVMRRRDIPREPEDDTGDTGK